MSACAHYSGSQPATAGYDTICNDGRCFKVQQQSDLVADYAARSSHMPASPRSLMAAAGYGNMWGAGGASTNTGNGYPAAPPLPGAAAAAAISVSPAATVAATANFFNSPMNGFSPFGTVNPFAASLQTLQKPGAY